MKKESRVKNGPAVPPLLDVNFSILMSPTPQYCFTWQSQEFMHSTHTFLTCALPGFADASVYDSCGNITPQLPFNFDTQSMRMQSMNFSAVGLL